MRGCFIDVELSDILRVILAVLLVLLNGFFVIAEFALVKVRRTRLEELAHQGDARAQLAKKLVDSLDTYLSATQLGITLASLGLGWLGEPAVTSLLEPLAAAYLPHSPWLHMTISIAVGFSIITFMHIVLGELVPKSVAIQNPEKMALFVAWPLYIFYKIGYPIIALFNCAARSIMAACGIKAMPENDAAHSEEELRMIVSASQRGGALNPMEGELIGNVFNFVDRLVREVMIPRQDINCVYLDDPYEESMRIIRETHHTRYPLCLEDKDHILGMVHLRDIMHLDSAGAGQKDLRSVMREILVAPENMSIAQLMQLMRRKRIHLAVVADEYGGTAGLVALEDVLEEIVGEIEDEHDEVTEIDIKRLPGGSYEFDGKVLLDDVTELLAIALEEHDEDTIGGYIFGVLGRRPAAGDQVNIGAYTFEVLLVHGFRIVRVKACPAAKPGA